MKLRLSDIEPVLAQRIRDEEQQTAQAIGTGGKLPGATPFHDAIKSRETAKFGLRTVMGCGVPFMMLPLLVIWRSMAGSVNSPVPVILISMIAIGCIFFLQRHYRLRIDRNAEAKLLPLGLAWAVRGKEEKLYGELVEELSKSSGATENSARSLLREMNALMGSYRTLEQRYEDSNKAMRNRSVEGLEAELRGLEKRAEAATDAVTREALEQSAQLCASRIESARALTLAQERAKAQQEVVLQTLGSVHAAFAHMRNAPNDIQFETEQLMEKVNDLQNRTRAVEQAVEELVTARTR